MENPEKEIETAINLCAGAADADVQIDAFQKYMVDSHSFLHPLCYVPPGKDSLHRVVGIFMFYRAVIWKTKFTVNTCGTNFGNLSLATVLLLMRKTAFDKRTNNLYVDLIQQPHIRLIPYVPAIPMHCHFHVQYINGLYYIDYHEDIIQLREIMMAIPGLNIIGYILFTIFEYAGLFWAYVFMILGYWTPTEHIEKWRAEKATRTSSLNGTKG